MILYFIFPLIAFVANIINFSYNFSRGYADKTNRLFSYFILSLALWSLGDVIIFSANSPSEALLYKGLPITGACLTSVFLLHFFLSFTKNKMISNRFFLFLLYIPPIFFIFAGFFTNWITSSTELSWWGNYLIRGIVFIPYSLFLVIYIVIGLLLCINYFRSLDSLEKKIQIKFLILAILIPLIGGILTQIIPIIFKFKIIPLTSILTTFSAFIISYAIIKHDLLSTKFFSVYNKLIASFIIVVLLSIIIGAFSIVQSRDMLESSIGEGTVISLNTIMEKIDNAIISKIENFQYQTNSQNIGFQDFLHNSNDEFKQIGTQEEINNYIMDKDQEWITSSNNSTIFLNSLLNNQISEKLNRNIEFNEDEHEYELYGEIFVTNKYGANIGLTQKTSDYYQADESWWIKTKENGIYIGEVEYDQSSEIYSTTISVRIDDNESNFIGILKAVWNIQEIIDILETSRFFETREYYESISTHLLDFSGRLIYSTNQFEFLEDRSQWLSKFKENSDQSYFIYSDNEDYDSEKLIAYTNSSFLEKNADHNWILTMDCNTNEIFTPIFHLRNLIFISTILIIFTGLIIAYILSRTISKPLIQLRNASKEISQGKLDTKILINSNDEIGDLAFSFNQMIYKLKQSRSKIEEYNRNLEQKVIERTAELIQSKKEIEQKNETLLLTQAELEKTNKNLEEKVEERTHQINNLLKQKDEFINQLGHDLKNPLGPLISLLPILENNCKDDNNKRIIKVLQRNVHYMKTLVNNTLELARLNSPNVRLNKEAFNLTSELNNIIAQNTFFINEKNMKVNTHINNEIIINADKLRFEELINNIITNAIKYSNDGGIISIHAEDKDNEVHLSIKDNGIGMTQDQLERLFDEFYKADESRHDFESSGLGLPIAKRIVEKHGGKIWVKSEGIGMGSTFHFTLPKKP